MSPSYLPLRENSSPRPSGSNRMSLSIVCALLCLAPLTSWTHGRSGRGVSAFSPPPPSSRLRLRAPVRASRSSDAVILLHSAKSPNDGSDAAGDGTDGASTSPSAAFTVSPITVTSTESKQNAPIESDPATNASSKKQDRVNSATLRFNNKLNRMSKNFDAATAPKVEALLLEAVEQYQTAEVEGGNKTSRQNMIVPNTVSFTNAITAWARCTRKDSARRAQSLLEEMHKLYEERGWDHVRPNKISYNSVITAWARSRERGSARHAEELLRGMYDFYNAEAEGGGKGDEPRTYDDDLKPDARSWNAVINAVARSRDDGCADQAKFLLDEMGRLYDEGDGDLLPDALTFGAIINAYANSFEEGASDKAAQLLMHMESLSGLGFDKARPTTFVYNACMNAFAKDPLISNSGSIEDEGGDPEKVDATTAAAPSSILNRAEQAEQLLTSMERRYEETKDHRVMPDCISYSTVINAYANSHTPASGANADAVLRRMIGRFLLGDTKCRPNAVSFTAAMKAHSAAINATLSTDEGGDMPSSQIETQRRQSEASARRCEDLLQELCLLHRQHGNDRSLRPTGVTFDLAIGALARVGDAEGARRAESLRDSYR